RQRQGRRDEVGYHQLEGLEHPVLIRRPGDAGGNQSNERCVQDDQTVLENALVGDEEPNDGQQQRQQQRNPQRAQRRDDGLQTQVFEREVNHQQPEGGAQLLAPRRLPATLGREGPGSRLHTGHPSASRFSTRAGLPPTRVNGGTSLVTMLPAATTAPRPMRTPLRMMQLLPIQTSSSITTGATSAGPSTWGLRRSR